MILVIIQEFNKHQKNLLNKIKEIKKREISLQIGIVTGEEIIKNQRKQMIDLKEKIKNENENNEKNPCLKSKNDDDDDELEIDLNKKLKIK
jgi:phage terminase large subunit-like protein